MSAGAQNQLFQMKIDKFSTFMFVERREKNIQQISKWMVL